MQATAAWLKKQQTNDAVARLLTLVTGSPHPASDVMKVAAQIEQARALLKAAVNEARYVKHIETEAKSEAHSVRKSAKNIFSDWPQYWASKVTAVFKGMEGKQRPKKEAIAKLVRQALAALGD
mmetsp:Transcript_69166/g.212092  ORF Transcript_69166/g.212092 Transcript_69166/m.212092 type:complete len:123 (-) Transcript_69166:156-524(-)